jgi:hypothetical protein
MMSSVAMCFYGSLWDSIVYSCFIVSDLFTGNLFNGTPKRAHLISIRCAGHYY